jgi:hypothetical protein
MKGIFRNMIPCEIYDINSENISAEPGKYLISLASTWKSGLSTVESWIFEIFFRIVGSKNDENCEAAPSLLYDLSTF